MNIRDEMGAAAGGGLRATVKMIVLHAHIARARTDQYDLVPAVVICLEFVVGDSYRREISCHRQVRVVQCKVETIQCAVARIYRYGTVGKRRTGRQGLGAGWILQR